MHGWNDLKNRLITNFPELIIEDNFCTISLISDELTNENLISEAIALLKENNIDFHGISLTNTKLNIFLERADLDKGTGLFHKNWIES